MRMCKVTTFLMILAINSLSSICFDRQSFISAILSFSPTHSLTPLRNRSRGQNDRLIIIGFFIQLRRC
jgi:hypothetical protein